MPARAVVCLVLVAVAGAPRAATAQSPRSRADWIALKDSGFGIPAGQTAMGLLTAMRPLLGSPDPVLRDDVAFSAAEKWIVRERLVAPDDIRKLMTVWLAGLQDGLESPGDDRIYTRTFSALSLSLVAARDVATPFLTAGEAQQLFDRLIDYLGRERDLRGYDPAHGWGHAVAHTSDALKFLARGPQWAPGNLPRLLATVRARLESTDAVFVWGEMDRLAQALHAAIRRPDADTAAVDTWVAGWNADYTALWANGPQVAPTLFARVENARQLLRSLHAALSMEVTPAPPVEAVRRATLLALAKMR